jgi:hypothetical protein
MKRLIITLAIHFLFLFTLLVYLCSCSKDCEICTRDYMKQKGYLQLRYPIKFTFTDNNGQNYETKRFYSAKELCKFNECE